MDDDNQSQAKQTLEILDKAIAAGLKVGFWKSLEDVEANIKVDRQFTSEITEKERNKKL